MLQDEENKKLLYLKDQLLIDGDLTSETNRTFRYKLRDVTKENVVESVENSTENAEDDEIDDERLLKRRKEMMKWKIETAVIII